ncbi:MULTISPECIES: hypothetical protein [Cupriavidus]|uniref:Uncharacterized protein n=1 Tax=Cupriavidus pinatubonensis (strain JMP 134 / LMG 1197) TaxID=264198 RepID=Q46SB5_CUPPJ|nr:MULTISPECIES: hypothetical protein [Cupriavidus]QYY28336.1 hypothetical protein K2O51_10640 [Cupriavidus pinatubonensis]
MKRSRCLAAVVLLGLGVAAGVALSLKMGATGIPDGDDTVEIRFAPEAVVDYCDDVCVRGRGAAALIVFSQWPSP